DNGVTASILGDPGTEPPHAHGVIVPREDDTGPGHVVRMAGERGSRRCASTTGWACRPTSSTRLPRPRRNSPAPDPATAVDGTRSPASSGRKPANLTAVTVELALLSRVSYRSLEITGSRLQALLALLAENPRAGCST